MKKYAVKIIAMHYCSVLFQICVVFFVVAFLLLLFFFCHEECFQMSVLNPQLQTLSSPASEVVMQY